MLLTFIFELKNFKVVIGDSILWLLYDVDGLFKGNCKSNLGGASYMKWRE